MKICLFYHSLVSDWNHGNAHFLRGNVAELIARGHQVTVYEPAAGWSLSNLRQEHGEEPLIQFQRAYPELTSVAYDLRGFDVRAALRDADLVIVHEWTEPELVKKIGEIRRDEAFTLLFHDTHHRLATDRAAMARYDLSDYDGVLAYGKVLRDLYLSERLTTHAWTWHEAADTNVFHPRATATPPEGDLVWIGNWGDDERTEELHEFLIKPVSALKLRAKIYGVRYPESALRALADAGIEYGGWLPNFKAPEVFSRYRVTVHVPRRPYVDALPGIPTIRPFEVLACGLPLVCSPWHDTEKLFTAGRDYLVARDGDEMKHQLERVLTDGAFRAQLIRHGLGTIRSRHTCAHRVDELLAICATLRGNRPSAAYRTKTRAA